MGGVSLIIPLAHCLGAKTPAGRKEPPGWPDRGRGGYYSFAAPFLFHPLSLSVVLATSPFVPCGLSPPSHPLRSPLRPLSTSHGDVRERQASTMGSLSSRMESRKVSQSSFSLYFPARGARAALFGVALWSSLLPGLRR